jgi:putative heme-binding domain-containing protein
LIEVFSSPPTRESAGGKIAVIKALSRLPADLLSGNEPQIVKLQELRSSAARDLVQGARRALDQKGAGSKFRASAVEMLAFGNFDSQHELLEQLLSSQESAPVRAAALATLGQYASPGVATLILAHFDQFSPAERQQAADVLLRRGPWALAFAQYLANEKVPITTLDPSHISRLQNYPSGKVREIVRKLGGQGMSKDRQKVFQDYKDGGVLTATGDPSLGKQVFEKNCSSCHEIGGIGHQVGPNLASMINRGAESVLFNVLAPNAEVDPRFMEYVVATADGQVISGVVAGETPTAVTLRGPDNKVTTILRVDIDDIHSTGKSLMPEGLEKVIDKKSMTNLIAFLKQAASQGAAK